MLIQFCENSGCKVLCDKPTRDNFEVENLVKRTAQPTDGHFGHVSASTGGFMLTSYTRPPANLYFIMPCNVALHSVIIDPQIGQNATTLIDLLIPVEQSRSFDYSSASIDRLQQLELVKLVTVGRNRSSDNSRFVYHLKNTSYRNSRLRGHQAPVTYRGHADLNAAEEQADSSILKLVPAESVERMFFKQRPGWPSVSNVRLIVLRLRSAVNGSSSMCLRLVEIFARVSDSESEQVATELANRLSTGVVSNSQPSSSPSFAFYRLTHDAEPSVSQTSERSDSQTQQRASQSASVAIPDDFLDAVTCELMTTPYTLPSGSNVDADTLRRLSEADVQRGRVPSDPFSGVSLNRRPARFNFALKQRIDLFVQTNAEALRCAELLERRSERGVACVRCKARNTDTRIYALPCSHKVCQQCLFARAVPNEASAIFCPACGAQSFRGDVERVHRSAEQQPVSQVQLPKPVDGDEPVAKRAALSVD